jgi:hypothetical protein
MTDKEEIKELLSKEEIMFEEKYSGSSSYMRKSLILDNFDKIRLIISN